MKITVTVKSGTKNREEVVKTAEGLTVYTKSPAIEGRANQAVVKLLADYYDVPKTSIKLLRGASSKIKIFEIP